MNNPINEQEQRLIKLVEELGQMQRRRAARFLKGFGDFLIQGGYVGWAPFPRRTLPKKDKS